MEVQEENMEGGEEIALLRTCLMLNLLLKITWVKIIRGMFMTKGSLELSSIIFLRQKIK